MTSPAIADGVDHPLDPRIVPLERATGWFLAAPLTLVLLVVALVLAVTGAPDDRPLPWPASAALLGGWAAGSAALAWFAQRWPVVSYRHTTYRVDEQGLEIRRGVHWRRIINVPRSRVQHTDVSQGPLERRFGLGTLVVYTAGTDHARVALAGLDHAIALRIREHLLPRETGDAV